MELKRRSELTRGFWTVAMAVLVIMVAAFILPQEAQAWPTKYTSCSSCHSATEPTASVSVALDGVTTTSITVAPGASFEIDYIARNIAGNGPMGLELALPAGWTIGTGTANAPVLAGWNGVWDNTAGVGAWATADMYSTASEFASSPDGYTVNFNGSGWDSGNRNAAFDDASGGDLDGTANEMGVDATITVPGGATPGVYTIQATGVGHNVGGTKGYVTQAITVTVSGGNNPPAVPANPAQYESDGVTAVALSGYSTTTTLVFEGDLTDPDADTVKLQIDYTGDNVSDCESALVASGSTNVQVTCAGLTDGSGYDWQYRAVDSVGDPSAWTAFNAASPDFTVDATAPTDGVLTPTPGDTQIVLNWTAATDATSGLTSPAYKVVMATGTTVAPADCSGVAIYTGDLLTHTETGLTNGVDYAFRVCATDNAGLISTGATGTAQPAAGNTVPNVPANLEQTLLDGLTPIAVGGYTSEASVIFEADLSDPDGGDTVKLQIDTNSDGTFDCESALVAQQTNYELTCPLADGSYNWQARTVDNSAAASGWVAFNAANPDLTKDASAPTDGTLTATSGNTQIVLNWTAASDAHSGLTSPAYKVVMATGTTTPPVDCSGAAIYTGDLLTHTETGLTNGVDYAFRVCATNNAGLQSGGTTDTAQPAAGCTPAPPTVSLAPAAQTITNDGGLVVYTVTVTNNDSACADATFTLSANDTNGTEFYSSVLSKTSMTIASGAFDTTTVTVQVIPGNDAVTNDTTVTATDSPTHDPPVVSSPVTTTVTLGGGCVGTGVNTNATAGGTLITGR